MQTLREKSIRENKHLEETLELYNELKKASKRLSSIDTEKLFCLTKRSHQRLAVLSDNVHDFSTRIIAFSNTLQITSPGTIQTHSKIIKHSAILQDSKGKSIDTEDFPTFNYEELGTSGLQGNSKQPKTRRHQEKLKQSIHNSTSPRINRNHTVKQIPTNYVTSNKMGQNITYDPEVCNLKDFKNMQKMKPNFGIKNHRSMLKLHEKGMKEEKAMTKQGKFTVEKTAQLLGKYHRNAITKIGMYAMQFYMQSFIELFKFHLLHAYHGTCDSNSSLYFF